MTFFLQSSAIFNFVYVLWWGVSINCCSTYLLLIRKLIEDNKEVQFLNISHVKCLQKVGRKNAPLLGQFFCLALGDFFARLGNFGPFLGGFGTVFHSSWVKKTPTFGKIFAEVGHFWDLFSFKLGNFGIFWADLGQFKTYLTQPKMT